MVEPSGPVVRRYVDSDMESCRRLWRQLTETHRHIYNDPDIGGTDPGHFFDEHLTRIGSQNTWVAEVNGNIIGLMGLEVEENEVTIEPLVVSEDSRGKGIGQRLFEVALREANRLGATYLNVNPVARNADAIRFFSSRGMNTVGHVELFMDLKGREWRKGMELHGVQLRL